VGALLAAALAIRVVDVERTPYRPILDAGTYLKLASQIAHTGDESTGHAPGVGAGGTHGPSAYFPPAYPYFLGAVDLVTGHTTRRGPAVHTARLSQAVLGTGTVALAGLVALEAFGETVGLIALGLAALYPVLVELSGTLVAENLLTALVLAAVWAALRARRSPRPYRWIAAAGVLGGLAILTHVNAVVIALPLAFAAWRARPSWTAPALLVGVTLLALVPWTVRNAIVMHSFVPVTDETGITLVGTYNRASASFHPVPYKWRIYYDIPGEQALARESHRLSESALSARLQRQAFHYIGEHPLAPLAVLYHNTLRLLELEGSVAWRDSYAAISLWRGRAVIGVASFWALCLFALAGAFTRVARGAPRWLWAVPVLLWLTVALVNAETPRFREPVDAFLVMLAACALAGAYELVRQSGVRLSPR
jgi:4-amino-4-deoxy-L-arabinose transferase-like glycosyltransferase